MTPSEAKAAIGKRVFVCDGTPKPPARFKNKVADWERRNFEGELVEVEDREENGHMCTILFKDTPVCKFHRTVHHDNIGGLVQVAEEVADATG